LNARGLANIGTWLNNNTPLNIGVPKYELGIYGGHHRADDALQADGADPSSGGGHARSRRGRVGTSTSRLRDAVANEPGGRRARIGW
jgi:hypothetical protein